MLEQFLVLWASGGFDCMVQVDGVPKGNGRGEAIQARSAVALIVVGAVPELAKAVEKHGPCESVAGFAFVQAGLDASAKTGDLHPV